MMRVGVSVCRRMGVLACRRYAGTPTRFLLLRETDAKRDASPTTLPTLPLCPPPLCCALPQYPGEFVPTILWVGGVDAA
jgi:hypothetical protein